MSKRDAVVIGAGHNGLVAAAYLAGAGLDVLVLERRGVVGGAAATEELFDGFRVDTGSPWLGGLSPTVVDDLGLEERGVEVIDADPCVFAPGPDGSYLMLRRDPEATAREISKVSRADAARWVRFTQLVARAAGFVEGVWATTPPDPTGDDLGDLWSSARLGLKLRGMGKREMVEVMRILPMSIYELLDEWFESDLVRGTLAAGAVTGLAQGPMAAGTAYTFLHHHVGAASGVIRPARRVRGGTGRLTEALAEACEERGAEIRLGTPVEAILLEGGEARGVALADGEEIAAGRVVSSADPRRTFFGLVGPEHLSPEFARKISNIRYRGVTATVHLALSGLPGFTAPSGGRSSSSDPFRSSSLHQGIISVAPSLEYVERAWDAAKYGRISEAPVLTASIPSVGDSSVAPEGKHLVSVTMQYAPYELREGEWDEERRQALGDLVVDTLAEHARDLPDLVEARRVMTPADLEERFGLTEGDIHHGEMTLDQLLFMRPVPGAARYRTPLGGLWLCGAGTHPGGGVTGVPGWNAAREMLKEAR